MLIRPEQPSDEPIIRELTATAFDPMPFSNGSEASILDGLRNDGDLTVSLVAIVGEELVGHIAFSPVTVGDEDDGWYGLGPISVWPDCQRRGIGSALIEEGLSILKAKDARGCVLVGNPKLYERFGFQSDARLTYQDLPSEYVQGLTLRGERPAGRVTFSAAFERENGT